MCYLLNNFRSPLVHTSSAEAAFPHRSFFHWVSRNSSVCMAWNPGKANRINWTSFDLLNASVLISLDSRINSLIRTQLPVQTLADDCTGGPSRHNGGGPEKGNRALDEGFHRSARAVPPAGSRCNRTSPSWNIDGIDGTGSPSSVINADPKGSDHASNSGKMTNRIPHSPSRSHTNPITQHQQHQRTPISPPDGAHHHAYRARPSHACSSTPDAQKSTDRSRSGLSPQPGLAANASDDEAPFNARFITPVFPQASLSGE